MSNIITGILDSLRKHAYANAKAAFWQFGDAVLALRKHGSNKWANEQIRRAFPNALAEIGYALGDAYLSRAASMAAAFAAEGGLMSPDGKHSASREQIDTLGLAPADQERLGNLVEAGKGKLPKGAHRLRVSDIASAIKKHAEASTPAEKVAARQALLDRMAECERSMTALTGSAEDVLAEKIRQAQSKVTKLEGQLLKAKNDLAQLKVELRELTSAEEEAVEEPKKPKGSRRTRITTSTALQG